MRIGLDRDLRIDAAKQILHFGVITCELSAAEIGPLFKQRVVDRAQRPIVFRRKHKTNIGKSQTFLKLFWRVLGSEKLAEILNGKRMLEYAGLCLHAGVVEMNQIGVKFL